MSKNREARQEARAPVRELGVDTQAQRVSDAEVPEFELQSDEQASESTPTQDDEQPVLLEPTNDGLPAPADDAEATRGPAPAPTSRFEVAPGKAITSHRGILEAGKEAKPEYFPGGQKTLDELLAKGYVVRREVARGKR
jgi:hypothetical protein